MLEVKNDMYLWSCSKLWYIIVNCLFWCNGVMSELSNVGCYNIFTSIQFSTIMCFDIFYVTLSNLIKLPSLVFKRWCLGDRKAIQTQPAKHHPIPSAITLDFILTREFYTVMLVLVLKDSLRTKMQSLSWSLSLTMQSLSLLLKSLSLNKSPCHVIVFSFI